MTAKKQVTAISTTPPSSDPKDYALAIVKGAVSEIPIAGGVASEILALVITPSLERRREEWVASIAEGLVELQQKVDGFELEKLSNNEDFVTAVLRASQTAQRTQKEEKLTALRNAVLNSALPNAPDEDIQLVFLNYIDSLTTWHLRVLALFRDPTKWAEENARPFPTGWHMGGVSQVIGHAYPELMAHDYLVKLVVKDLDTNDLAQIPLGTTMTLDGMMSSRTTSLGNQFLDFVTAPRFLS
jgi:hypothetical protein